MWLKYGQSLCWFCSLWAEVSGQTKSKTDLDMLPFDIHSFGVGRIISLSVLTSHLYKLLGPQDFLFSLLLKENAYLIWNLVEMLYILLSSAKKKNRTIKQTWIEI